MTTVEALAEMMQKYNEYQAKWIAFHGTKEGFDAWFTQQVLGK